MGGSGFGSWPPLPPAGPSRTVLGDILGRLPPGPPGRLQPSPIGTLLSQFGIPEKRKIFVSYQHRGDQVYKEGIVRLYCDQYDLLEDNSIDRIVDTDDLKYVEREIREDYIRGASVTIVLCGATTHERKFVDWEIYATLLKKAALVGIQLPTLRPASGQTTVVVPARLHDNIVTGYALWKNWDYMLANPGCLRVWIEEAMRKETWRIDNSRPKRQRNG